MHCTVSGCGDILANNEAEAIVLASNIFPIFQQTSSIELYQLHLTNRSKGSEASRRLFQRIKISPLICTS